MVNCGSGCFTCFLINTGKCIIKVASPLSHIQEHSQNVTRTYPMKCASSVVGGWSLLTSDHDKTSKTGL